jgi:uncharacterized protein
MIYLDTSVLVAALTREQLTERVQHWLVDQAEGSVAISGWTRVEFAAALRFKVATRQIDESHRAVAAAQFADIAGYGLVSWPIDAEDFEVAGSMAASEMLGLRAPDALHFAIAWRRGAALCTLDDGLRRACVQFGHSCISP